MKPSFVRFPGGCFVEGDTLAQRFNWKLSLGEPSQRAGNRCIWGYKATNGLGYHEYLQWCEDLGAEPLFVVNCGMSHKDTTPLSQMDGVVQDALDALEYANGDAKAEKKIMTSFASRPSDASSSFVSSGEISTFAKRMLQINAANAARKALKEGKAAAAAAAGAKSGLPDISAGPVVKIRRGSNKDPEVISVGSN